MTGWGAAMKFAAHRVPARALVLLLAVLAGGAATAQDDGRTVIFRVLCLEHAGGLISAFAPAPGKEGAKIEVPLFTSEFSGEMKGVFTGGQAALFTEQDGPDGKPARKVVARGALAASPRQAFLVVPAGEQAKDKSLVYQIVAYDDREDGFPMGSTRVVNFAPFPVRLNLAGADLPPIPPAGSKVYPQVRTVDEWNMFSVRIDFAADGTNWVPVASQSWKASERKRDWVVTRFDAAARQPIIRLYQDIPPWRQPKVPEPAPR